MSEEPRVRWTGRTDVLFHDVAEALGIETDQIMGAQVREPGPTAFAMYTVGDGLADSTPIMMAVLVADRDGMLRVHQSEPSGKTIGDMKREIEEGMG